MRSRGASIGSPALGAAWALAYYIAWTLLVPPFTPFPCDDIHLARGINATGAAPLAEVLLPGGSSPVYFVLTGVLMKSCLMLSRAGCSGEWTMLHLAIASNALIVLLLGLIVFRLTQNLFAQTFVHAAYAFAAWPVTYYFMLSAYTVTAAALVLLAIWFALPSERASAWRSAAAGAATGLALWTSSSGPLTAGLLAFTSVALHWKGNGWRELLVPARYDLKGVAAFSAGLFVAAAAFSYALPQYLTHLADNVSGGHGITAQQKLGFVPQPPFFSYLHALAVYGQAFLALLLAALAALAVFAQAAARSGLHAQTMRPVAILALFVLLHALLIDVLPTTKLARTHFPAYPVSMAIVGVVGFEAYRRVAAAIRRSGLLLALALAALAGIVYEGLRQSAETRHARTALARDFEGLRANGAWFVLLEDKHRTDLWMNLNWRWLDAAVSPQNPGVLQLAPRPGAEAHLVGVLDSAQLAAFLAQPEGKSFGLLLGPRGPGSGLSLAVEGTLEDFYPDRLFDLGRLRARARESKIIPYYMHYPPFLMEEEVRQALFFMGRIPDYRAPDMGVLALRF